MSPLAILPAVTVVQVVAKVGPETNPALQPGNGLTWCNRFVALVAAEMGAQLGGVLANEQAAWLASKEALAAGWAPATEQVARQWADVGQLALAAWRNPSGHGHIAVLVPSLPAAPGKTRIAQAGGENFSSGSLSRGFGAYRPKFFTHHPKRICEVP